MKKVIKYLKTLLIVLTKVWYGLTVLSIFSVAVVASAYQRSFSIDVILILFGLDVTILFFLYSLIDKDFKNDKLNKEIKEFLHVRTNVIYILLILMATAMIGNLTLSNTEILYHFLSNLSVTLDTLFIVQCFVMLQKIYNIRGT